MKKVTMKLESGRTIEVVRSENPRPPRGITTVLRLTGDDRPVGIDGAEAFPVFYKNGAYTTQGRGTPAGRAYRCPAWGRTTPAGNARAVETHLLELSDWLSGRVYDVTLRDSAGAVVQVIRGGFGAWALLDLHLNIEEETELTGGSRRTDVEGLVGLLGEIPREEHLKRAGAMLV